YFKTMSTIELKRYALTHRGEVEPLRELYHRRTPDEEATWFKLPTTKEEEQQQFESFKRMIDEQETKS
ncbi:MAG: hypothetical protein F6K10_35115, partial [Moorea sp. SIO2B7]|nr:hypothetical protein [Moorena sp. SIO2B7]